VTTKPVKGKIKIQTIFCPWCHAPLVFHEGMNLSFDHDERREVDRYECTGPDTHTILVMMGLEE